MRRWGHLAQRGVQLNTANATSANTRPRSASGAASRRRGVGRRPAAGAAVMTRRLLSCLPIEESAATSEP